MGCSSWHILSGINPVLHMIFTFMQMYYLFMHSRSVIVSMQMYLVFMHSRLNINKNKIIAKFGLMHLLVKKTMFVNTRLESIFLRQQIAAFGFAHLSGQLEEKEYLKPLTPPLTREKILTIIIYVENNM